MKSRRKRILAFLMAGCMCLAPSLGALAASGPLETVREMEVRESRADDSQKVRTVYLSDIDWDSEQHTTDSHLPTQKDKSFGGGKITLKVDGTPTGFDKGIGTQTDSTIEYNLEGKGYTQFEAYAGVDYSQRQYIESETCDVRFSVLIDGVQVKQTAVLDPESEAEHIVVEIPENAKRLTLYADKVTETWSDHADWAGAKFTQVLPEPQNVALGKAINAYKTADGSEAPHNPDVNVGSDKAVDGVIDTNNYFDFGDPADTGAVRQSLYVQLDLMGNYLLSDIQMWRYWSDKRIYDATVIAVSETENFDRYEILYNSDSKNVHGLGQGEDAPYQETSEGRTFTVPENTKARYVRVYTYGVKDGGVTNHIVELQVNAYVFGDEIQEEEDGKVFPNAESPLYLEGPGTENQVTHPDVQVLDEAWNGYRYWMGYTPNRPGTSYYENPCIAASSDGENWEFPAENPVQPRFDSETQNENEHNCDTDLLYDPVNNRMILYWEWANDLGEPMSEIRYRISYDGIHWGVPGEDGEIQSGPRDYGVAIRTDGARYSDLSPTVLYDKNEKIYKMWANDAGNIGYENKERNKVWYRTSEDGLTNWSNKTYVNHFLGKNEDGLQMYPWHQDIQWVEEFQEYWALQQAFPQGSGPDNSSLRFSKSKDGINWEPVSEKALITVGAPGTWDAGQIYRSTFWYEPGEVYGEGTFHIWYAALATGQSHWDIGYTSANYSDVMYKLTGSRPAPEKRMQVDNEHPLLIMPLYGKSYSESGSVLDWGDDLVSRWQQVPEDLKQNAVIELHVGGKIGLNESDSHTTKAFYEQQLKIAQENGIPVFIVVATAGLKNYWTGTANLTAQWADEMFKKYSVLKGIMSTENYWTDYGAVANIGSEYMRVAHENGGYFLWSEHQEGVIENIVANTNFKDALERYGDSFIFTWKNTPAGTNSNAGSASYMQGLWLTGMCAQWGGLADTWKWYEKRFGKLFGGTYSYNPGGEEARPVATEPEALLGIEMMSIYTNGGCVYNFEHPAYVYGSYNLNSPAFENVIAPFMRYAISNPAPGREEVLADTEVAFYGSLNALKSAGKLLQKGIGWEDATLPTQVTGRYGLIPAVPGAVEEKRVDSTFAGKTLIDQNTPELAQNDTKVAFFDEKYEERYTGTGFGQMVNGTWYLYNSNVNVDGTQNTKITFNSGKDLDVVMTPHTYVIMKEEEGNLNIKLNNYRVDKDSIWEGYGDTVTDRWDTDNNTKLQDWVRDTYIPDPDDDQFRDTTFCITGLDKQPVVVVDAGLDGQFKEPDVDYDNTTKTAVITVSSNGWVDFTIREEAEVPTVWPDKVELDKPEAQLTIGDTLSLAATVSPAEAQDKSVAWSSSDDDVASVKDGVVTAKAEGTAEIKATTVNDKYAVCKVTVKKADKPVIEPTGITVNQTSVRLAAGESMTLTATVLPAEAQDKSVTWSSSDSGIASVKEGVVTAVAKGTAVITAATANGKQASCTVNVTEKPAPAVSLSGAKLGPIVSQKHTGKALTPEVTVTYGTVVLERDTDYTVSYKNNVNPGTATVIVTGMGGYYGSLSGSFTILAAKGKTYKIGKAYYKVTNAAAQNGTVTFVKPDKKTYKTFSVPSIVKIGKYSYKVTEIGKNAFRSQKKLTKVTIGSNVRKIGAYAFYGSKKLKRVVIKSRVLKSVGKNAFRKIYTKAVVKVPGSKLKSYRKVLKGKGLSGNAKIKK